MRVFSGVLSIIIALLSILSFGQCANILGIFTVPMASHTIVHLSVAKVLAERGHNLTVVTLSDPPVKHKDFTVIQVPPSKEDEQQLNEAIGEVAASASKGLLAVFINIPKFFSLLLRIMENALRDPQVKALYENKDNKFDLVITGYLQNDFQLGIAHKLKVPVIAAFPQQPLDFIASVVGNPSALSSVPGMLNSVEKGKVMSFGQRLKEVLLSWGYSAVLHLVEHRNRQRYRSLFGNDPSMPEYDDLSKNITLIFFNSYALSDGPIRPNVPAVVEIGGIQIKDQPDPLPSNMAEFLRNATEGAILLSLGSNIKGTHLTPNMVQSMFRVLSTLPQRVIWKWDDLKNTPGTSKNILYSKWLPQDDILAHPSIKLFITHAGKGGTAESQYHGKPMLAIPFFGDQPGNAESLEKSGYGLSLVSSELNEENFRSSIVRILEDPSFTKNVKAFSELYRDRPLSAKETVIYWTEYVLRHRGAPHMQSPLVHLSFVAAHNIDIYFLIVLFIYLLAVLFKFIIRLSKQKLLKVKKQKIKKK